MIFRILWLIVIDLLYGNVPISISEFLEFFG